MIRDLLNWCKSTGGRIESALITHVCGRPISVERTNRILGLRHRFRKYFGRSSIRYSITNNELHDFGHLATNQAVGSSNLSGRATNKKGAPPGPLFYLLCARMKKRTPVRQKSTGLSIWNAKRPEQSEGEDQGWSESNRMRFGRRRRPAGVKIALRRSESISLPNHIENQSVQPGPLFYF